jgi:hypothetical protein
MFCICFALSMNRRYAFADHIDATLMAMAPGDGSLADPS